MCIKMPIVEFVWHLPLFALIEHNGILRCAKFSYCVQNVLKCEPEHTVNSPIKVYKTLFQGAKILPAQCVCRRSMNKVSV